MRALSLNQSDSLPKVQRVARPEPFEGGVRVKLSHAALNRRDVWIAKGMYPKIQLPAILGSDGVGTLMDPTSELPIGTRVVLYPGRGWGNDENIQSKAYEILGMPAQGTFAEEIIVPSSLVYAAPRHLTDPEAAALPLAGLTAWRSAFTRGGMKRGERVLVTGVGGGVATLTAQFAIALGADVCVTSSSETKLQTASALGCQTGLRYDSANFKEALKEASANGFNLIVDGAGGAHVDALLRVLAPAGRFVFYGGTAGKWPEILPQRLFFKQVSILASTMGSPKDFSEMLGFVDQHKIRPIVDGVFPLQEGVEAFRRLESGAQMGKVVIGIE